MAEPARASAGTAADPAVRESPAQLADALATLGEDAGQKVTVALSNELVQLLSEQLYQSPLKAIEELVVNSWDADATECRVFVPQPDEKDRRFVAVYDNGVGMDIEGLKSLWYVGHSNKRGIDAQKRAKRQQIGKFGIGKLATYAIATKVTYLTRQENELLAVTLDFNAFSPNPSGVGKPIELDIRRIKDPKQVTDDGRFQLAWTSLGVTPEKLVSGQVPTWTLAVLESLKPKLDTIQLGRLRWVLSTAMPMAANFDLFLNNNPITSSKAHITPLISFTVDDLPKSRIANLSKSTQEDWSCTGIKLISPSFPSGITGTVIVTDQSLHAGKSTDLGRSHGFFIMVRGRLVNEEDPLFGLSPLSYQTFNRFRADLEVDDLDAVITAPREGVIQSGPSDKLEKLLGELFYEARDRYEEHLAAEEKKEQQKKEHERNFVSSRLVEHPVADVLSSKGTSKSGPEPDESWFYLQVPQGSEIPSIVETLYSEPRQRYTYTYSQLGPSGRLVQFNPETATFYINADHEFVKSHADDGRSRVLLEDFVTAEALLEVYLREFDVPPHTVGEVLERRDLLLRGLARDHPYSLDAIAQFLKDSKSDERDLEVALVEAARSLGFVAKHISGGSEPDGLARLTDYPTGEKKITLEAKSSVKVPSLGAIDFAGLAEHVGKYEADGCLLVAPSYPGKGKGDYSAAAARARKDRISCWTTEQLATVVQQAESRHLTARHVLDVVLTSFTPDEVAAALDKLLAVPTWAERELYVAVLHALRSLEGRLPDTPRTIDLIAGEVSRDAQFAGVRGADVERAVSDLASGSHGALTLRDGRVQLHTSYDEIERRLTGMTGSSGEPRRGTTFRNG